MSKQVDCLMKYKRSSGILLHPTSLPGPFGIGDLGPQAYRWIDFLSDAGCSWWQVLPLGPTGYGDSPYQSFSAFAGNPYLISPQLLFSENLLSEEDLGDLPKFPAKRVDYEAVIGWKNRVLDRAYERTIQQSDCTLRHSIDVFKKENTSWLEDFAVFMALKDVHGGLPWHTWETKLRDRDPDEINQISKIYHEAIQRHIFKQYLFFKQWGDLHSYALKKKVRIIGDLPIFVSHDSADVWVNPEFFYLKKSGKPKLISGVPPDYFSPTGQIWGNPLYRWKVHQRTGFKWWISRFRMELAQFDMLRLDHFRGFAGYWEIPGDAETADNGRWVKAPGNALFKKLKQELGDIPVIAEDLGVITPDVEEMRKKFGFPGMKILLFAFSGDPQDPYRPHNYPRNCVAYTGTHDNDTALGWYQRVPDEERKFCLQYMNRDGSDFSWDLIRTCWSSVGNLAIAPMQDFLNLDNQSRMNYPGNPSGNWQWRMQDTAIDRGLEERIREINRLYDRFGS